jgi:cysteine desulfurase/selenocysteine lyase
VRDQIRQYINAQNSEEIVFTSGTTDSINIVASGYLESVSENENIVVSELEHHSNYLPWKRLSSITDCELRIARCNEQGILDESTLLSHIDKNTKIIAITGASNVSGDLQPLENVITYAHSFNCPVLIDAAQLIVHQNIDVQKLDCDYLVFSSHKLGGPTGCGILYGKTRCLQELSPGKFGGGMIQQLNSGKTKDVWAPIPNKFEAGTLPLTEVIGLGATLEYLNNLDMIGLRQHEADLANCLLEGLGKLEELHVVGNNLNSQHLPIASFTTEVCSSYDIGLLLAANNIAVRTGSLCAQPLINRIKTDGFTRISLGFYNTEQELKTLFSTLEKVLLKFRRA